MAQTTTAKPSRFARMAQIGRAKPSRFARGGKPPSTRHAHSSLPAKQAGFGQSAEPPRHTMAAPTSDPCLRKSLVVIARGKTPDPIPNSAVKTLSADGTAPQGAEE